MTPHIHINWAAIAVAVVANFILGYLWYGPLFGKAWAREMKMDMNQKPPASVMIRGMLFMVIGNFLMAFVFAHNIAAWDPTSWEQPASAVPKGMNALMAAMFTTIGFYLPPQLSAVAWEGRSWKFFFINTIYHFCTLLVAALIIMYMS